MLHHQQTSTRSGKRSQRSASPRLSSHHLPHRKSALTIPSRNVNMYKFKAPPPVKSVQDRHSKSNRHRRQEAEQARYNKALEIFEEQRQRGVSNPVLPEVSPITQAQKRRLDIRKAMQSTLKTGDLSHIPLMIQFLHKMHGIDTFSSSIENQDHLRRIKQDTSVLQHFRLLSSEPHPNDQQQQQQDQSAYEKQLNDLVYSPGDIIPPTSSSTIASPISRQIDPVAMLNKNGNELSSAILGQVANELFPSHADSPRVAHPIGQLNLGDSTNNAGLPKHYRLPAISNSITGSVVTGISLGNPDFGSGAGSPTFRLTALGGPDELAHNQMATTAGTSRDEIEALDRRLDAEMALAGEGMIGLHENTLQKHADEFSSQNMIPTLGFLGSFRAPQDSAMAQADSGVAGLDQQTISGIGGLSKLPGHNPGGSSSSQGAIISGRRSRAIEIIAKTAAAILTKKQLLAHNKSLLEAINPNLVRNHRESKKANSIDLYQLGYEITRIQLSKDLANCTIFWSAKCLFPLAETTSAIHELERPLLDTVQVMQDRSDATKRVELHPSSDAMNRLPLAHTHVTRRANHQIGDLYNRHPSEFSSTYNQAAVQQEIERNQGAELFFDDESNVTIKKMSSGELRITSQGNPKLWALRPMFQSGSYMPGTVDVLPPQFRSKVDFMSEQQRHAKQMETDRKHLEKLELLRAESMLDPETGLPAYEPKLAPPPKMIGPNVGLGGGGDEDGDIPSPDELVKLIEQVSLEQTSVNNLGEQALETLLRKQNTTRHSTMSLKTFQHSSHIVAAATNSYLNSAIPSIRWALGKSMNTKFVPQVTFEFDLSHGAAQQRASTINAVLQRQFKRQLEQRENQADKSIGRGGRNANQRAQVEAQIDDVLYKTHLVESAQLDELHAVEQYEQQDQEDIANRGHDSIEKATGFDELADIDTVQDEHFHKEHILQDNIAKLRASAESLKTGRPNKEALQTRLKYHDISIEDKRRIAQKYLDLDNNEVYLLTEERLDTVLSMLRREMSAHERRKARDALEQTKKEEGLSPDAIREELLRFDQQHDAEAADSDNEQGVVRWQAGVDDESKMPQYQQLLHSDGETDHETSSGDDDEQSTRPLKTQSNNRRVAPSALDVEDLVKYRDQYLNNKDQSNSDDNDDDDDDDDDGSDHDSDSQYDSSYESSDSENQDKQQSRNSAQFLVFSDSEEDVPSQPQISNSQNKSPKRM